MMLMSAKAAGQLTTMRTRTSICFLFFLQSLWCAPCLRVGVLVKDKLGNLKPLDPKNGKWFQNDIAKKYGLCYSDAQGYDVVFFITVTPDVYHGTRVVTNTTQHSDPLSGTVTNEDGSTSRVNGTVETSSTTSTAVPYSFDYGIYDLYLVRPKGIGEFEVIQRFQQKGIYHTLYGIPLGGRGHHPVKTVIEDAAKWIRVHPTFDPFR